VTATAQRSPGRSRLRILAEPDGSVALTLAPARPPPEAPARLTPFTLRGGLGAHKWRDRRLLEALSADVPGMVPLLLDGDGLVLEAAYANLWIVEGDELITPPADRRILAGVTRADLLAREPGAREEAIELARLLEADDVFLTSSLSGRHPAVLTVRGSEPPALSVTYLR
jgi:para-aminobenzoate synthetase/4-amino-4-deoxychorismate lyase